MYWLNMISSALVYNFSEVVLIYWFMTKTFKKVVFRSKAVLM